MLKSSALVAVVALAACTDGTVSSIQIHVTGDGRVYSRDGTFDCRASGGTCSMSYPVSAEATSTTSSSFHLIAQPATTATTEWEVIVEADCPNCNSDDPEMGALDVNGNEADLRIDMNAGYDVYETLNVTFHEQPAGSNPPPTPVVRRYVLLTR